MIISPHQSTAGSHHGSYSILKSLFRRIIACTDGWDNADLKLHCKHYIRSTIQGAIQTAKFYSTCSTSHSSSPWYAQHDYNIQSQFDAFHTFHSNYKGFLHPTFGKQYQYSI